MPYSTAKMQYFLQFRIKMYFMSLILISDWPDSECKKKSPKFSEGPLIYVDLNVRMVIIITTVGTLRPLQYIQSRVLVNDRTKFLINRYLHSIAVLYLVVGHKKRNTPVLLSTCFQYNSHVFPPGDS